MSHEPTFEVIRCALCDSERPLKKDGTFRKHKAYPWGGGYSTPVTICKGSGMTPTGAMELNRRTTHGG